MSCIIDLWVFSIKILNIRYVDGGKMRNILIVSGLLLLGLAAICVNETSAHPWTPSEKKVVNLEREYFNALKSQDQDLMSSLLHENFVISGMDRAAYPDLDKDEFLATMPGQVITWQEIKHVKVDIKGNVAKSVVDISMTKTYGGKDHSGDYEVYSVWVREEGRWLLLNRRIKLLNQA